MNDENFLNQLLNSLRSIPNQNLQLKDIIATLSYKETYDYVHSQNIQIKNSIEETNNQLKNEIQEMKENKSKLS